MEMMARNGNQAKVIAYGGDSEKSLGFTLIPFFPGGLVPSQAAAVAAEGVPIPAETRGHFHDHMHSLRVIILVC